MIYVCHKKSTYRGANFLVEEFTTEKEALTFLAGIPRSHIVGVFEGKRLEPVIGEKHVVQKAVTSFGAYKKEVVESEKD